MLIGVPKEVKTHEYRVGLTPGSVREIVHHGHEVMVEAGAGTGVGFEDASYEAVGARILPSKTEVFAAAELIVKVKEPQPQEAAALRRSQELQRGFLSRLSHELRTPLTAIRGYASSLMQPDVTWDRESQQRFLDRIAAESARLGRLVDDLLDFSAIESGIMRLQWDWCDIRLVVEAAIGCLPPASAASVALTCDASLPVVWADHDRMEQVFVNLLNNASRHNPPGTPVYVTADYGTSEVVISVRDDGVGMPPELAAAPFEPARRPRALPGNGSSNGDGHGKSAGTGLGLWLSHGIVQKHEGSIRVRSRTTAGSSGTVFSIFLPDGAERVRMASVAAE